MHRIEYPVFEEFEWDEDKRLKNLGKHGIDFTDAARSLLERHVELPSHKQAEQRTKAICTVSGRLIVVIFTMRGSACRIISARAARKNEKRTYRQIFGI